MVSRATAATPPSCDPYFRDNYTHTTEGRAYAYYGYAYAHGSSDFMGLWNILHRDPARADQPGILQGRHLPLTGPLLSGYPLLANLWQSARPCP